MTREEAINYLKSSGMSQEQIKSVTDALTCEDCISREAVIKHICESKECYKDECKGRLYKRCYDIQWIYDLPSITPQPKMGKWIYERCDMYTCSECGHKYTDLSCEQDGMNFCPNCGAKMEVADGK